MNSSTLLTKLKNAIPQAFLKATVVKGFSKFIGTEFFLIKLKAVIV